MTYLDPYNVKHNYENLLNYIQLQKGVLVSFILQTYGYRMEESQKNIFQIQANIKSLAWWTSALQTALFVPVCGKIGNAKKHIEFN